MIIFLQAFLLTFILFSYVVVGMVAFFDSGSPELNKELSKISAGIRFLVWLASPLILLDIVFEKVFGWRLI